jgi:hypothetical protein
LLNSQHVIPANNNISAANKYPSFDENMATIKIIIYIVPDIERVKVSFIL